MKVYLYSGMQKLIEKSGVGRAIYHQQTAAEENGIKIVDDWKCADIIHINTVFPKSLALARKAHKRGIPVVYHAHSTKEDFKNSYIGSDFFDSLFGLWIKHCYNAGDVIVTPTPYSKRLLEAYGIQKEIDVISNGIDLDYYDRDIVDSEKFRSQYGYKKEDKIIMSVGLTIERKGILDFVELARRMPQYQFIWFGETNLNLVPSKIKKAVQTSLPNLRFAGYVNKEKLREAYGSCDLFLFPSKEETEGIVVLEALAMKIPVLLRDIPVYEDWLWEDVDVYKAEGLDEFEEKSSGILEGRYPSLAESGYQCVQKRSIKRVGERLCDIYQETILAYRKQNQVYAYSSTI